MRVWYYAKQLVNGLPITDVTHHTVRFPILISSYLTQLLVDSWWAYFLPPLAASILSIYLAYAIVRNYSSEIVSFIIISVLIFFPMYIDMSMRLLPSAFSVLFILGGLYFLLKFDRKKKEMWLIMAALAFFGAYSAKVPNIFFIFGIVIGLLWLYGIRSALIFSFILLGGYLLEHTVIYMCFDQPLGRIGVILATHFNHGHSSASAGLLGETTATFFDKFYFLFTYRLEGLYTHFQIIILLITISGLFMIFLGDKYQKVLAFGIITFMVLMFFGFKSWEPLKVLQPNRARYFYVIVPIGVICAGFVFVKVCDFLSLNKTHIQCVIITGGIVGIVLLLQVQNFFPYKKPFEFYNAVNKNLENHLIHGGAVIYPLNTWGAKNQILEDVDDKNFWWIAIHFLSEDLLFNRDKLVVKPFKHRSPNSNNLLMIMNIRAVPQSGRFYYIDPDERTFIRANLHYR